MSSWSALLALQGFIYDGPKQTIGFKPTWQPEDHASFFTTSTAWGLFTQTQSQIAQTAEIAVKFGTSQLENILLAASEDKTANNISVKLDDFGLIKMIRRCPGHVWLQNFAAVLFR